MIAEAALAVAGPDARLVGRPAGVAHVYVGPLTPAGYVPRRSRPVCGACTRRLTHLPERRTSLACESGTRRVCARCSLTLSRRRDRVREHHQPTSRGDWVGRYAGMTVRDLWAAGVMAETLEELEHVGHASLVALTHRECQAPFPFLTTGPHAAASSAPAYGYLARIHRAVGLGHATNLTRTLGELRERLAGFPNRHRGEALDAYIATGYAAAKAERVAARQDRKSVFKDFGLPTTT